MKIGDYQVPLKVIEQCVETMKNGVFRASDIALTAKKLGVEDTVKDRLADRLIQLKRKAGMIEVTTYPYWTWKN